MNKERRDMFQRVMNNGHIQLIIELERTITETVYVDVNGTRGSLGYIESLTATTKTICEGVRDGVGVGPLDPYWAGSLIHNEYNVGRNDNVHGEVIHMRAKTGPYSKYPNMLLWEDGIFNESNMEEVERLFEIDMESMKTYIIQEAERKVGNLQL